MWPTGRAAALQGPGMAAPKTPRDRCGGDARCARWLLPGLAWLAAAAASAQPMPVTWQRSWSAAGGASEESAMVRALPEGRSRSSKAMEPTIKMGKRVLTAAPSITRDPAKAT